MAYRPKNAVDILQMRSEPKQEWINPFVAFIYGIHAIIRFILDLLNRDEATRDEMTLAQAQRLIDEYDKKQVTGKWDDEIPSDVDAFVEVCKMFGRAGIVIVPDNVQVERTATDGTLVTFPETGRMQRSLKTLEDRILRQPVGLASAIAELQRTKPNEDDKA